MYSKYCMTVYLVKNHFVWHFGHADYKYLQCLFLRRSLWKYESSDVAYCIYLEKWKEIVMC